MIFICYDIIKQGLKIELERWRSWKIRTKAFPTSSAFQLTFPTIRLKHACRSFDNTKLSFCMLLNSKLTTTVLSDRFRRSYKYLHFQLQLNATQKRLRIQNQSRFLMAFNRNLFKWIYFNIFSQT